MSQRFKKCCDVTQDSSMTLYFVRSDFKFCVMRVVSLCDVTHKFL